MGLALLAAAVACGASTAPDDVADVRITLAVSGGFAAVNWGFEVDGSERMVVGGPCERLLNCDWVEGEVLGTFDPARLTELASEFFERGFFEGPADYGAQCCDQFFYSLTYSENDFARTVAGSDGTIPEDILALIRLVEQFVAGVRS